MATIISDINPYSVMALASMFVALMGFLASILFNRRTETSNLLNRAEDRETHHHQVIQKLEKDLEYCRARVKDLMDENIILLRKLAGIEIASQSGGHAHLAHDVTSGSDSSIT